MAALIVPIAAPGFNRPTMASQSHRSVQIIGAFKLLKGLLLIGLATGGIALLGKDVETTLTHFLKFVHADPGNHFIKTLLTKAVGLSPRLPLILIGSFIYGAIFTTEGLGLLWQQRWAEYLTVITTGSFLPFEAYELYKQIRAPRLVALLLNAAIVIYLIIRLRRDRPISAAMSSDQRSAGGQNLRREEC